MADTEYQFTGSQLADYVGKCRAAWEMERDERTQALLDDTLERCRTAEKRGWDAAMIYATMVVKSKLNSYRTLDEAH